MAYAPVAVDGLGRPGDGDLVALIALVAAALLLVGLVVLVATTLGRSRTPTSVRATTMAFRGGALPGTCVVTGEPADGWWERGAKSPIGAQWLLLLVGILPFVLVRVLTVKQAQGYLPIARSEATNRRQAAKEARRRLLLRPLAMLVLVAVAIGGAAAAWTLFEAHSEAADAVDHGREQYVELKGQIGDPVADDGYEDPDLLGQTPYLLSEDGCIYSRSRYQSYTTATDGTSQPDGTYVSTMIWSCNPTTGVSFDIDDAGNLTTETTRSPDESLVVAEGGADFNDVDAYEYLFEETERVDVNLAAVALIGAGAAVATAVLGLFGVVLPRTKARARTEVGGYYPNPALALDRSGERLEIRHAHPRFVEAADRVRGPAGPPMPSSPVPPVTPAAPTVPTAPTPVVPAVPTPPAPAVPVAPVDPGASATSPQASRPGIRGSLANKTPPERPTGQ